MLLKKIIVDPLIGEVVVLAALFSSDYTFYPDYLNFYVNDEGKMQLKSMRSYGCSDERNEEGFFAVICLPFIITGFQNEKPSSFDR